MAVASIPRIAHIFGAPDYRDWLRLPTLATERERVWLFNSEIMPYMNEYTEGSVFGQYIVDHPMMRTFVSPGVNFAEVRVELETRGNQFVMIVIDFVKHLVATLIAVDWQRRMTDWVQRHRTTDDHLNVSSPTNGPQDDGWMFEVREAFCQALLDLDHNDTWRILRSRLRQFALEIGYPSSSYDPLEIVENIYVHINSHVPTETSRASRRSPEVGQLRPQSRDDFEIAIICALPIERDAIEVLLDEDYEADGFSYGKAVGDPNAYTVGRLGNQHVVMAYPPVIGMAGAAAVAASLRSSFRSIRLGIVVGICGGVPASMSGMQIHLGDVIISTSVVQIDFGRQYPNRFIRRQNVEDILGRANPEIRAFVGRAEGYLARRRLKDKTSRYASLVGAADDFSDAIYPGPTNDILYPADYRHRHQTPAQCICTDCAHQNDDVCERVLHSFCADLGCDPILSLSPRRQRNQMANGFMPGGTTATTTATQEAQKPSIHFGRMACSNQVVRCGQYRNRIAREEDVIGFEMESAGTWDVVPTVVIKSVSDYADSHKSKRWQGYAAATAAACTKAFLEEWRSAG